MKIIVDAFGGDNAPLEILRGTAAAIAEYGIEAAVCGDIAALKNLAQAQSISVSGMDFIQADSVMPVEAEPTSLLKAYADSSMAVGLKLLAEGGGDAFVTAGSTGAAVVGASLIVKRIKGVKRPALAPIIPDAKGCHMMLDIGANTECRPEMLAQFAVMGTAYMRAFMNLERPRVGLVNIGTEANKGTDMQIAAYKLLQKMPVHFIGNVEARDLPLGVCDIALTDGFTGNIILKHTEGMAKFFSGELKGILLGSATSKLAALILKKPVQAFRKKLDHTEYGGTPLMGIRKPVIKAHGSSNAHAFKNAIRQARQMVMSDISAQIETAVKGGTLDEQ